MEDDDFIETVAPVTGVPSPCVAICRLDPATGWCVGCRRTLQEIAAWPNASEVQRQAIVDALSGRRVG